MFALDVGKGLAPVLLAQRDTAHHAWLPVAAGLAAIIGHNFSVFLRFKGGKGVATTLGVAFGLSWVAGLVAFGVWLVVLALTRYISVVFAHRHPDRRAVPVAAERLAVALRRLRPAGDSVRRRQAPGEHGAHPGGHGAEGRPEEVRQHGGLEHVKRIILASGSPRRRELLGLLGLPFTSRPATSTRTASPRRV